jgi:hypothetical protein
MADSNDSNHVVLEEDTWKIPISIDISPDNVVEEDTWKIPVSTDIGPDNCIDAKLTCQLQEHCVLKQAINIFPRPHHLSYNSLISRTRSFKHAYWPETNPSLVSLAEAGFFYDRKLITV